jgi:hypothetical protein
VPLLRDKEAQRFEKKRLSMPVTHAGCVLWLMQKALLYLSQVSWEQFKK